LRVLLIDRSNLSARELRAVLERDGFGVFRCDNCEEAIEFVKIGEYDAILLAHLKPGAGAGLETGRLRRGSIATPILALSDDPAVSSRIAALAQGADDCLSRPFHKAELCARLRTIIRRSRSHSQPAIRIGNLEINTETRDVQVGGRAIHLTVTEYRILELLALRKERTVSKDTIFAALYDGRDDPGDRVVHVFASKIRKKIAAVNHGQSYITTIWGGGYRLSDAASLGPACCT
jgi:two-component system cell cycle response regulator CtrA